MHPSDAARILAEKTGIPANQLEALDTDYLKMLKERIGKQLVHQETAVNILTRAILRYKMRVHNTEKPWGVFLSVGPTGVGKILSAKLVAKELFHNARAFVRIDISEYSESHAKSRLIGAPPGYLGHDDGGQLTEQLRAFPHSIVLLDEIEKAHKEVLTLLLQMFDEGRLTDGKGRCVDTRGVCFIMTSNLGAEQMLKIASNTDAMTIRKMIEPYILKHFSPELFNRIHEVIPFKPLPKERHRDVIAVHLKRIQERLTTSHKLKLTYDASVITHFLSLPHDTRFGVRKLCDTLDMVVGDALADLGMKMGSLQGIRARLFVKNKQLEIKASSLR